MKQKKNFIPWGDNPYKTKNHGKEILSCYDLRQIALTKGKHCMIL